MQPPLLKLVSIDAQHYCVSADRPLRIGQLITFLPSETIGAVTSLVPDKNCYLVSTPTPPVTADTQLVFTNWWKLKQPASSARLVASKFFEPAEPVAAGIFKATAQNLPKQHVAGSLGWDLWYRPDSKHPWLHILRGHDADSGQCLHIETGGKWPVGHYLFKASAFYQTNLIPLARQQFQFELAEPTLTLDFTFQFDLSALIS
jgi:hypothetical protein